MNIVLNQGAEAKILQISPTTLKKIRDIKTYRLSKIDTYIRKSRNKKEFKILNKLYEHKINVPKPIEIIQNREEISFTFEYIKGSNLKNIINKKLLFDSFEEIIKMHNLEIVHGDLTTLNIIIKENKTPYLIDFGLSEISNKIEDKAVDLNLFFNCIKNEHPNFIKYKKELLNIYLKKIKNSQKIIIRLKEIEKRGRNKK